MSTQELKPDRYALADGTISAAKTCIVGPIPEQIAEGDWVVIVGLFCGPPAERISILLTPESNDRGVMKFRSKLEKALRSGQKFVAQLQPPRGTFHITALSILVGEDHPVTQKIHQIEVISACVSRVKQLCSCISPKLDIIMATPIKERLSYNTFYDISPETFSDLKNIYEDIILIENCCAEMVQSVSSESSYQIWQGIVELADELCRLHERCFLALRPFNQGHLLHFLPGRMWKNIQLACKCLCIHRQTKILRTFLDKAKSILERLIEIAPEFTESWNDMVILLQDARTYIGLVDMMN